MIYVDTNVWMYAVGGDHPLKGKAREFFREAKKTGTKLCTSAEVIQELLHVYLATDRMSTCDAALKLLKGLQTEVFPLESEDSLLARELARSLGELGARDLIHLASCRRRDIHQLKTFDRALNIASEGRR